MKKLTLSLVGIIGLSMMISCGGTATEEAVNESKTAEENLVTEEVPTVEEAPVAKASDKESTSMDLSEGKALYLAKCKVCHQENGEGLTGAFPPLAKSDYLADKTASIKAPIHGLSGEIVVNGVTFNSVMAPVPMSDEELVSVMNYVYNSWGNEGTVTLEDVAAAK